MTCRLRTGLLNNDESHHDIYRLYQMDSTLAGLMTCESAVSPSESGAAPKETDAECLLRIRSVSQAGSVRSDDAYNLAPAVDDALRERPSLEHGPSKPRASVVSHGDTNSAVASSLTAPSSITLPRALRPWEKKKKQISSRAAMDCSSSAAAPREEEVEVAPFAEAEGALRAAESAVRASPPLRRHRAARAASE